VRSTPPADEDRTAPYDPVPQSSSASLGEPDERLARQLRFLIEIDAAKTVLRRSYLMDGTRRENDGEHMWHVAVAAMVLSEHADETVDPTKVLRMLLVHDIVEVDAGDTFVYDEVAARDKPDRERRAADRLFNLLPSDQSLELRALWEEFEARRTAEARLAAAIDRLLPLLANVMAGGRTWQEHGVVDEQVRRVNRRVGEASASLQQVVDALIDRAVHTGMLDRASPAEP
jgi:putative hydrolases of HD superfamily